MVLIGLLAGCVTGYGGEHLYGSGPISFSPSTQLAYKNYHAIRSLLIDCKMAFAVTLDGQGSTPILEYGFHCPRYIEDVVISSVNLCEKENGRKCLLYAVEEKVVWKQ